MKIKEVDQIKEILVSLSSKRELWNDKGFKDVGHCKNHADELSDIIYTLLKSIEFIEEENTDLRNKYADLTGMEYKWGS